MGFDKRKQDRSGERRRKPGERKNQAPGMGSQRSTVFKKRTREYFWAQRERIVARRTAELAQSGEVMLSKGQLAKNSAIAYVETHNHRRTCKGTHSASPQERRALLGLNEQMREFALAA